MNFIHCILNILTPLSSFSRPTLYFSHIRLRVQIHFLQTYWVYLVSPIYTIRCMAIHWSALDLPMSILLKSSYRLLIGPQLGTGIHMSYPFLDWLFVLFELSQVFSMVSESLCILYGPALLCPEKNNINL